VIQRPFRQYQEYSFDILRKQPAWMHWSAPLISGFRNSIENKMVFCRPDVFDFSKELYRFQLMSSWTGFESLHLHMPVFYKHIIIVLSLCSRLWQRVLFWWFRSLPECNFGIRELSFTLFNSRANSSVNLNWTSMIKAKYQKRIQKIRVFREFALRFVGIRDQKCVW
jgi:hypothetical protein